MKLTGNRELEESGVVANCRMNRERDLLGSNGYDRELRFNPLDFVRNVAVRRTVRWLDLCCGSAKALIDAAIVVDAERLPVEIVGVDLVDMFRPSDSPCLSLVQASLSDWAPTQQVDLITCVHGLHYIGDKLRLISNAAMWLSTEGLFAANLDMQNIALRGTSTSRVVAAELRGNGFDYCFRRKLLRREGRSVPSLPFRYLGADDQAGPNYTGQPAVTSHYEKVVTT